MHDRLIATPSLTFTQPAPVSADIKAVAATLGMLAGEIPEAEWMVVRLAIKNLVATAAQVETMERSFPVPREEEASHAPVQS